MLKLNDIQFPVTFTTVSCGKITCLSKDRVADSSLDEFHPSMVCTLIDLHNKHNPDNIKYLPYYVEYVGTALKTDRDILNSEDPEIKTAIQCTKIENMPLNATLKGVQLDDKSWFKITATPRTIEVHDDIVTLLLHHGGFKNKTVSGEISIKRGTLVRYEVK